MSHRHVYFLCNMNHIPPTCMQCITNLLSYMTSTIICLCTVLNTCQGCRIIMCNTA